MEYWRWSPGEIKVHTAPIFGRYLMRNYRRGDKRKRIKWNAEYRDRNGKIIGYDFIISAADLSAIEKLRRSCEREKSGTEIAQNGSYSIPKVA